MVLKGVLKLLVITATAALSLGVFAKDIEGYIVNKHVNDDFPWACELNGQSTGGVGDIDVTTPGVSVFNLTDDGGVLYNLPFEFDLFDKTFTSMSVSNNGGLVFGPALAGLTPSNTSLPTVSAGYSIFPFWDDIDNETGRVLVWSGNLGAVGSVAIIEWEDRPHFDNTGSATFRALISEFGDIMFHYIDIDFGSSFWNNGNSATVGVQGNGNVSQALQISLNESIIPYTRPAPTGPLICLTPVRGSILDYLPAIISGATQN